MWLCDTNGFGGDWRGRGRGANVADHHYRIRHHHRTQRITTTIQSPHTYSRHFPSFIIVLLCLSLSVCTVFCPPSVRKLNRNETSRRLDERNKIINIFLFFESHPRVLLRSGRRSNAILQVKPRTKVSPPKRTSRALYFNTPVEYRWYSQRVALQVNAAKRGWFDGRLCVLFSGLISVCVDVWETGRRYSIRSICNIYIYCEWVCVFCV